MILFLLSCFAHKTTLTGIVDYIGKENCAIELSTGDLIVIRSKICKNANEGDTVYFYGSLR